MKTLLSVSSVLAMAAMVTSCGNSGANKAAADSTAMAVDSNVVVLFDGTSLDGWRGYNWGAGKISRVRAIEKCCFIASGIISLLAVVVILLFPGQITGLFMADASAEVMALSIGALQLFAITYITRWFSFATQSYMLAIEKPLPASIISVSTALVFPVLLIGVLWPLGLTGIWLNFAGTALLAAILSVIILLKLRGELFQPDHT